MAKRVFDARSAPEEEIAGVREALTAENIDFYETRQSNWGFGSAGLWVRDPADHARARRVIDEFQADWRERARSEPVPARIAWGNVPLLLLVIALLAWITLELFSMGTP